MIKPALLMALFTSTFAFADVDKISLAQQNFCEERLASKNAMQSIIAKANNQLSFMNQGGFLNGGVCWWHSRFTRAAAYLAIFDPSLPYPSREEAKEIINHIRKRKGMIVIPGFRNLYEFSNYYSHEIIEKLEDWQRSDTVMKFSWFKGMVRNVELPPEKLEEKMHDLYKRVQDGEVVYQMLQMPGVVAHAWLVVGMRPTSSGYIISAVDSNFPGGPVEFPYYFGSKTIDYIGDLSGYTFVPHAGNTKEERKLRRKMERACGKAGIELPEEDDSDEE